MMKVFLWIMTSLMMMPALAQVCGIVTTQHDPLNIREKPGFTSKVIDQAVKGSALVVLKMQKGWYKVQLNNGKMGYGSSDYIKAVTPKNPKSCGIVATKETPLNIRQKPNRVSKVLVQASKGSALRILGLSGSWFRVLLNDGDIGYGRRDYIQIVNGLGSKI